MSIPASEDFYANAQSGREFGTRTATLLTLPIAGLANAAATVQITFRRVRDIVHVHIADVAQQAFGGANGVAVITGVPAWAQPLRNVSFIYTRKGIGGTDLSAYLFVGGSTGANPGEIRLFDGPAGGDIGAGEQWGIFPCSFSYSANLSNFAP